MQPSPEELRQKLCHQLMVCHRAVMLYPPEHPQVGQAIDRFKKGLRDLNAQTGRALVVDSLDRENDGSKPGRKGALPRPRQVLRLNRIQGLSISQDALASEIVEFCRYLQLDSHRGEEAVAGERERRLVTSAATWSSIDVSFFEFRSEQESDPIDDVLKGAALRHAENLEPVFQSLPEETRSRLRAELTSPQFLLKMSLVRKALQKLEQPTRTDGARVDLVEEIVHAGLPDKRSGEVDADEVIANIHRLTDFVQKNVDVLSGIVDSLPADADRNAFRKQLREAVPEDTTALLASQAGRLQKQKERLSFLFQTAPGKRPKEVSFDGGETEEESDLLDEEETQIIQAGETRVTLEDETQFIRLEPRPGEPRESSLPESDLDLDLVHAPILDDDRVVEVYLCVVLDLLHRGRHDALSTRWPLVLNTIHRSTETADRFGVAVRQVCEFQSENDDSEAERLLLEMLDRRDGETVALSLRNDVLPLAGFDRVERYLDGLQRRSPARAIEILTGLHAGERGDELERTARDRLLKCARKPEVLAHWAQLDPDGLLQVPVLLKVLGSLSRRQVTDAFRVYFTEVEIERSRYLIRSLAPAIPGGDTILFAALHHGGQPLRNAALEKLGDYPTEAVLKTLRASLGRNNFRSPFNRDEVSAILTALLKMDHAPARSLLDEVENKRRLLRHVYSAEIRNTLAALREKTQELHVTSHRS